MGKDACCKEGGMCSWFCIKPVPFVAGLIFVVQGVFKALYWGASAKMIGFLALSLVAVSGDQYTTLAMALGSIAIIIEIFGGLSFMLGCKYTSGYAAHALTLVALIILLVKIKGPIQEGQTVMQVFTEGQLYLLFLTIFATKAVRAAKCHKSGGCCGTSCCDAKKK